MINVNLKLSGQDLKKIFSNIEFNNLLYYTKVAPSPEIAITRLKEHFNLKILSTHGSEIEGIVKIRDFLATLIDEETTGALSITAPHTHWKEQTAIIYHYLKNRNAYIIGPHPIKNEEIYTPVSFVFNSGYPIPYEWVDSSVFIDTTEFDILLDAIKKLNSYCCDFSWPLAISLDFRFKTSLFEKFESTIELPINDINDEYNNYSSIIGLTDFVNKGISQDTEQVSWHPHSDKFLELNSFEFSLLSELRKFYDSLGADKEKYAQIIETALKN